MVKFTPLGNRVLVKELPISEEDRIINGIEVPEGSIPHRRGTVISVGEGERATATGDLIPMTIKKGDCVFYLYEIAYVPLRIEGEQYKLFRDGNIEAIIE